MPSIVVVSGRSRGYCVPLKERSLTVGRDEECDLQVLDNLVSRRHMEIGYDAEARSYKARDLDSVNGVFIDGQRISEPTALRDGDAITIGESKLMFTLQDFVDGETALNYFKLRGERGRSTMIAQPDDDEEDG